MPQYLSAVEIRYVVTVSKVKLFMKGYSAKNKMNMYAKNCLQLYYY